MKSFYTISLLMAVLFAFGGWVFFGPFVGISVLFGGVLSMVNSHWMVAGINRLLRSESPQNPWPVVLSFLARLVLIFGVLFAIILTSFLDVLGVVTGLSVGVIAAFVEEFRQMVLKGR